MYELVDYRQEINKLLESGTSLYESITIDLFYLSKQISAKERSIRASLITFISGIVLATMSYLFFNLIVKFIL